MIDVSKLLQMPVKAAAGSVCGVLEDVVLDARTGRITWWLADLGAGRGHAPVLVKGSCASIVRDHLVINLDDSALASARDKALEGHVAPFDMRYVPDLITGPFGNTVSPSMFMAVLNAWRKTRARQARRNLPAVAGKRAIWASDALGRRVFGPRGVLGNLRDIRINWDGKIAHLDIAKKASGTGHKLHPSALRHIPKTGDHLVVAGTSKRHVWMPEVGARSIYRGA